MKKKNIEILVAESDFPGKAEMINHLATVTEIVKVVNDPRDLTPIVPGTIKFTLPVIQTRPETRRERRARERKNKSKE